jgi:hypothetical protein
MSAPLQVVEERAPEAPKYPVVMHNVLTHLHENIAAEYAAVLNQEDAVRGELAALEEYRHTLEAVARAAGIALL